MSNAPDDLSWREGRLPLRAIGPLLLLYFATRFLCLTVLPMFLDEAVHLQWAERLWTEGRILKPIGAGRLLAVASYGLALPFEDRLLAARVVATFTGAVTLLFTIVLSQRLFFGRAGVIAGLLYILSPFALVYDRLALSDGFLAATMAGVMFGTAILATQPDRRGIASALTLLVALAVFSKVSALLFLPSVPLGAVLLSRERRRALRAVTGALVLGLLLASPMIWLFVSIGGEVAAQHVVDPGRATLMIVKTTLGDMSGWLGSYFTVPALIAAAISLAVRRDRASVWLGVSAMSPFVFFALFSQPWSARYVLPALAPFLILIAGGIDEVARRAPARYGVVALVLTTLVAAPGFTFDRWLLIDPTRAGFPQDDRIQLVTGWPAGYGLRELAGRLRLEATLEPIVAYVDIGGTRTVPTGLAVLLGPRSRVDLVEGDFGQAAVRSAMTAVARSRRVYAIVGPRPASFNFETAIREASLERIEVFTRPGGEWAATLFHVTPGH